MAFASAKLSTTDARMAKAKCAADARRLTDIPNVGPATAADLHLLGIETPAQLRDRDPHALYRQLCEITGIRHDPCVIDVFVSAVRFMQGAPPHPWWHYTAERKSATDTR
jgi:Pathogenicity locus